MWPCTSPKPFLLPYSYSYPCTTPGAPLGASLLHPLLRLASASTWPCLHGLVLHDMVHAQFLPAISLTPTLQNEALLTASIYIKRLGRFSFPNIKTCLKAGQVPSRASKGYLRGVTVI